LAEDAIKAAVADYQNKHAQGAKASTTLADQPVCAPT
ncbi:MAG: Fe-S cluster assembly scaffold IscU, partial [Aquabacterium sp.]|nr:Fe-S cluster assembly scaffold IscU [Aquabacterium sp.]